MIKKILLLLVGISAMASVSSWGSTPDRETSLAAQLGLTQCTAHAYCPQSGRTAACIVYANPALGQTCTWDARYAFGVRCTGWDVFGRWVVYQDHCP
ncbi:MAG: hypothetical protein ACK5QT_01450 [Oligoflexia bacterium]|jgi:hypothetical protein